MNVERISKILDEGRFQFSRSSGAGGQNVNKVETRVELYFNLERSRNLTPEEKAVLASKLKNRVSRDGEIRIVSQSLRTQAGNRSLAEEKLLELIVSALREAERTKRRRRTLPTQASRKRRLESKRIASWKKRARGKVDADYE